MAGTRLTRPHSGRMIAGVCAGIANHFDLDPTIVRVGYVLLSLLSTGFPGLLAYIVMAFVIPED